MDHDCNMNSLVFTTFFITHTEPSKAFPLPIVNMEEWRQSPACNTYIAKFTQTNIAHYL